MAGLDGASRVPDGPGPALSRFVRNLITLVADLLAIAMCVVGGFIIWAWLLQA